MSRCATKKKQNVKERKDKERRERNKERKKTRVLSSVSVRREIKKGEENRTTKKEKAARRG